MTHSNVLKDLKINMDHNDLYNQYIDACSQPPVTCVVICEPVKKQGLFKKIFATTGDITMRVKRDKYSARLEDGSISTMYRFQIHILVSDEDDPLTKRILKMLQCQSYRIVTGKHIPNIGEYNVLCSEHIGYIVIDGTRVLMAKATQYTNHSSILTQALMRLSIIRNYAKSTL